MDTMIKASKKQNNRKSGATLSNKARKRKEAEERQAAYNKLTLEQKLAKTTPGSKEHNKLLLKVQK